jgi:hypothetical protein
MGKWDVFGFAGQNWMWVLAGAFLLYLVVLVAFRRRETSAR